ncbi:prepilin-type N-terminal cleavage/methylation domain-containing protein [Deltaproteobacteria bacterium TL4]
MEKCFESLKCLHDKKGVTLLEIMLGLVIITVLLQSFQKPIEEFHQLVLIRQHQAEKQMEIERLYMLLKLELFQAGFGIQLDPEQKSVEISKDQVLFRSDNNRDGDLEDPREVVIYRFDEERQCVLRKSGKGAFQQLIGDVFQIRFEVWIPSAASPINPCILMSSRITENDSETQSVLCPLSI